jgi:hypothetical protein
MFGGRADMVEDGAPGADEAAAAAGEDGVAAASVRCCFWALEEVVINRGMVDRHIDFRQRDGRPVRYSRLRARSSSLSQCA